MSEGKESDQTETQCDDDELDALLDDALKDFEKPAGNVQAKPNVNITQETGGASKVSTHDTNVQDSSDNLFELTNNLTDVLEKMVMDEPSLKAHFDSFQQKMESSSVPPFAEGNQHLFDIDENMAKTFEDLTKNFTEDGEDFESMLKQMQSEMDCGEGELGKDGEGGFMSMMKGMMQNLLSKDLLYPSLKDIKDKYPAWLEENKSKISMDEYNKYRQQENIVCKLCQLFDEEEEDDSESVKSERMSKIVSLMEQMQEYGHPPPDMMENIVCGGAGETPPPMAECNLM